MSKRAFAAMAASILVALVSAPASAKTKAECVREWQADKAANQAVHRTEKAYVAECRGAVAATSRRSAPTSPTDAFNTRRPGRGPAGLAGADFSA